MELKNGTSGDKIKELEEIVEGQDGLVIKSLASSNTSSKTFVVTSKQLQSFRSVALVSSNPTDKKLSELETETKNQEAINQVEKIAGVIEDLSQVKGIYPNLKYSFEQIGPVDPEGPNNDGFGEFVSAERYQPIQNTFYENQWYLRPAPEGIDAGLGWGIAGKKLAGTDECLIQERCGGLPSTKVAVIDTGLDEVLDLRGAKIDRENSSRIYYSDECPNGEFIFDSFDTIGCINALLEKCVDQGNSAFVCQTTLELNDLFDFLSLIKCNAGDTVLFDLGGYKVCQENGESYDLAFSGSGSFHGTMVSSVIAMQDDLAGGVGVAYNTTILPIAIHTNLDTISLSAAMQKAIEEDVDVINLSLGGPVKDVYLETFVDQAIDSGIVVVASSGNEGNTVAQYPASYDGVISVGASNWAPNLSEIKRACYASFGSTLDIVAPSGDGSAFGGEEAYNNCEFSFEENNTPTGVLVASPNPDFNYDPTNKKVYGTSFTAPMVAGAVALYKSINPTATPYQVERALQLSALDIGQGGFDDEFGYGLLNIPSLLNISLIATGTGSSSSSSSSTSSSSSSSTSSSSSSSTSSTSSTSSSTSTTGRAGGGGGGRRSTTVSSSSSTSSNNSGSQKCFEDVESNNSFAPYICELKSKKVVSGNSNGTFNPNQNITRAEVVKIIYNTFEINPNTSCVAFEDVNSSNPLYNEILTLKCNGIINGIGGNNFAPNQTMTRAELIKVIMGMLALESESVNDISDITTNPYTDVAISSPFYNPIVSAYKNKIATGFEDKTFRPSDNITRGAVAKIAVLANEFNS